MDYAGNASYSSRTAQRTYYPIIKSFGRNNISYPWYYNVCKFAVEGLSETLAQEVKDFGIHVTIVEPNCFTTEWAGTSAVRSHTMDAYNDVREQFAIDQADNSYGNPEATVPAMLELIAMSQPPLHLFLGKEALPRTKKVYEERLSTWEKWSELSVAAHG